MIGFISDIHGNLPALSAVLEVLEKKEINTVYSLGDVAGYYPMVNECIDLLKKHSIRNILGNHDNYLINNLDCGRSASVDMAIKYQRSVITPENLRWLSVCPLTMREPLFYAVHGGLIDFLEEYTEEPDYSEYPEDVTLFLCGHTHKQQYTESGGKRFCNPGAVGQPRDKDPRAAYAILYDDLSIELCRVGYDIDEIAKQTKNAGFEKRFYSGLYTGEPMEKRKVHSA